MNSSARIHADLDSELGPFPGGVHLKPRTANNEDPTLIDKAANEGEL